MTNTNNPSVCAERPVFDRAQSTTYDLDGVIEEYIDAVISNWVMKIPDTNPAITEMFAVRDIEPYRNYNPWSGEFAGKYLTGAVQLLRLTNDESLRTYLGTFVDRLVSLQDPADGYLGPYRKSERLALWDSTTNEWTWDLWNHYHMMLGLLMWSEDTGDKDAFHSARAIADLFCAKFLDTGTKIIDITYRYSTDGNHAPIHGLALMYSMTGTRKYLELAHQIVDEFQLFDRDGLQGGDYVRQALAGKEFYQTPRPRWESLHNLLGIAELFYITGNEDFRTTFQHFWWSIAKTDRHNNGGFSSGEGAVGSPYHPGSIETCCTVAWIALSFEMLRMTENSIVADEIEMSTLNQVIGYQFRDGLVCTYNTPMDGKRISCVEQVAWQTRPGSEELICCTANAPRGFGLISDWALMCDDGGLVLNWYGPSVMKTQINGTPVTLTQVTEYPKDGRIAITVDTQVPETFSLKLRIPYWSDTTRVKVNGTYVSDVVPGRYLVLDREWASGDSVEINLDMSLRYWKGENECAGKSSVYSGPLLLALLWEDDQDDVVLDARTLNELATKPIPYSSPVVFTADSQWSTNEDIRKSKIDGATARYEFDGVGVEWEFMKNDSAGIGQIAIDGDVVADVDLYNSAEMPSSWKYTKLDYGRHVMEIVVTGKKNTKSKDSDINVKSVSSLQPQVIFEMAQKGRTIRLQDFGTVGNNGSQYKSWLNIQNTSIEPFSRSNPGRSWRP